MGDPFVIVIGVLVGLAAGSAVSIPYAFFCRAVALSFLVIPYNMVIGAAAGAAFAYAGSRQRQDVNPVVLIGGGFAVGFLAIFTGQAIVQAIGACPGIFLSPILLPMFGAVGAVIYLACQRGIRGKRDREREQKYRGSIARHAAEALEDDP